MADFQVVRSSGVTLYQGPSFDTDKLRTAAVGAILHGQALVKANSLWLSVSDNYGRSEGVWAEIANKRYASLGLAFEWQGAVWGQEVKKGTLEFFWSDPFDPGQLGTYRVLWELESGYWVMAWEGPFGQGTSCSAQLPPNYGEKRTDHTEIAVCVVAQLDGWLLRTPSVMLQISGFPDYDEVPIKPAKDLPDNTMLKFLALALAPNVKKDYLSQKPPGYVLSAEEEAEIIAEVEEGVRFGLNDGAEMTEARTAALQVAMPYVPREGSVQSKKAIVGLVTSAIQPTKAKRRGRFSEWAAERQGISHKMEQPNGESVSAVSRSLLEGQGRFAALGPRRVLVMGLYHACTNAMVQELQRHFEVEILNGWQHRGSGWKHRAHRRRPPLAEDDDVFCILMTKEPHFWLSSTGRVPRNFHSLFPVRFSSDGIVESVESSERKLDDLFSEVEHDGVLYPNAIALWSDTICSYFDDNIYPPERSVVVRCEDFLFRFQDVMDGLAANGLQKKTIGSGAFSPLEGRAKGHPESRTREEALQFYQSEENRVKGFTAQQLREIVNGAEASAIAALRYGPDAVASWV